MRGARIFIALHVEEGKQMRRAMTMKQRPAKLVGMSKRETTAERRGESEESQGLTVRNTNRQKRGTKTSWNEQPAWGNSSPVANARFLETDL